MSFEIALPSGLKGSIKELGIKEENLLSDPKLARSGKNLHTVLSNCWLETLDPGLYKFADDGFDVRQLYQGDGMALLVNLRIVTYGPEFYFDANCPICGTKIQWEIDLNEFLEVKSKPFPEESIRVIKEEQGLFKVTLPRCKKEVSFRLLTLRDEQKFPRLRKESFDALSSTLLDLQIVKIDGVERQRSFLGLETYPAGWEGEKEILSSGDASYLRDEIEEVNCGLFTTIDIECIDHGEVSIDLPFRENFLLPKRRKR